MRVSTSAPRTWLFWLPAVAMMVLIFVLSSQSGLRVSEDVAVERPLRVSGHLLAFGALAALLLFALARGRRPGLRDTILAFGIAVLYGATDELHQSFVPDRAGRIDDLVVDAVGALVGVVLAAIVLAIRGRDEQATVDRPEEA